MAFTSWSNNYREIHLERYGGELAKKIKNEIYVDNLITGSDSKDDAINLYKESKAIFKAASMNLREWTCNNPRVNQFMEFSDMTDGDLVQVLGDSWKVTPDSTSLKSP